MIIQNWLPESTHFVEEAEKILDENGGEVPAEISGEMTQTVLETSDIPLDKLSQEHYDEVFRRSRDLLGIALQEVKYERQSPTGDHAK